MPLQGVMMGDKSTVLLVMFGVIVGYLAIMWLVFNGSDYIMPLIQNYKDQRKLIPINERITLQDILSEGEWVKAPHSETTIKREYSSRHGVYEMTVYSYEGGYYIGVVKINGKRVENPVSGRTDTFEEAILYTYATIIRNYNMGGPHPKRVTGDFLERANSVGKERDHGDGETGEVVE